MSVLQTHFFRRYIAEGDDIRAVFHRHFLTALPNIFFWVTIPGCLVAWCVHRWFFPAILETWFLWIFELYITSIFVMVCYRILDWYCDVWIITDRGIIDVRWSLFTQNTTFTEFHDIAGIESAQHSFWDKVWNIGDITLHKMGDEMHIRRMYQPDVITAAVQANIYEHHQEEHHAPTAPAMNIYLDGVRQPHSVHPYKNGFRYTPMTAEDERFIETVRQKPGVIDLSGRLRKTDEHDENHDEHHGAHH